MTAIFFAGGEVETLTKALLDNGVRRILYSYYYIWQMRREGFVARMQEQYPEVEWFLDSGAFTYFAKFEHEPEKLPPWKVYKKLYFSYVNDTWERWCRIAELDLDLVPEVDLYRLADWREEMLDRWPQSNIMPVWHTWRGHEEWTSYCRDPRLRHLAIGAGTRNEGLYRRLVMEARQRNKTVHGLGMTRVPSLQRIPFDSVDSTSWLMGQKFGTLFVFQNNRFKLLGKDGPLGKRIRKQYRLYFRRIGVDWRLIEADDVGEVRRANIIAWRHLANRLMEMRKREGRSLYGTATEDPINREFVQPRPRPRERSLVEGGHVGPKVRDATPATEVPEASRK